jgi:hypothetical protein
MIRHLSSLISSGLSSSISDWPPILSIARHFAFIATLFSHSAIVSSATPTSWVDDAIAVGQTVAILPRDTAALRLIVFLPQVACQSCAQSVLPIRERLQFETRQSVDVTVFISTDDDEFVRQQKNIYGWKFAVIADPIRAYQTLYRVQRVPSAVLTNRCGVVLAEGRLGSVDYDWDTVVVKPDVLDFGCPERLNKCRLRKEIVLKGSEALSGAGRQRQVNIIKDSLIIVNATPLNKVMVFRMNGDSLRTFSHEAGGGYIPFMPMMATRPFDGEACLFIDNTYEGDIPITSVVTFDGDVIERKQRRVDSAESGRVSYFHSADARLETIVSSYRYLSKSDRGADRTGCIAWDRVSGNILHRFVRDSIHEQADLSNYHWTISLIDSEEIAYISNLSQTLNVHSRKDGSLLRTLPFNPDTSVYRTGWLSQGLLLTESSTIEERQALQTKVSATNFLLKDTESGDYYIGFNNFTVSGTIDGYISGPVGSPNAGTWFVGRSHQCHKISNGVLYASALQDGILVLSLYDLLK